MFERFTEKAVNAVYEAQRIAGEMTSSEVLPEHLLLALVKEARGVSLKIFRMYNITPESVKEDIEKYIRISQKKQETIPFSLGVKEILKHTLDLASKSNNLNILFEHLFLSVITDKNSNIPDILQGYNFDFLNARELLSKLVQRKIKKLEHPESIDDDESSEINDNVYEGEELSDVFERAVAKLTAKGYEILGTEQILESILESENCSLTEILGKYGINSDSFNQKLQSINSRSSEFSEKKVIFTPNAFLMMNIAMQTAKELGSSVITPEHIILGLLKSKKGIAYEIIKSIGINENKLAEDIIRPIEKQMPETLSIMKLAKEEARRIGRNTVGTEMFLLGIISEGASIAAEVLSDLEVTIKDARQEVESLIGYGNEYFDNEIAFTKRAKNVLEKAWKSAKKLNKQKIEATDLLLAITEEPGSVAMKVLDNLGVDAVEIKHGIYAAIKR